MVMDTSGNEIRYRFDYLQRATSHRCFFECVTPLVAGRLVIVMNASVRGNTTRLPCFVRCLRRTPGQSFITRAQSTRRPSSCPPRGPRPASVCCRKAGDSSHAYPCVPSMSSSASCWPTGSWRSLSLYRSRGSRRLQGTRLYLAEYNGDICLNAQATTPFKCSIDNDFGVDQWG